MSNSITRKDFSLKAMSVVAASCASMTILGRAYADEKSPSPASSLADTSASSDTDKASAAPTVSGLSSLPKGIVPVEGGGIGDVLVVVDMQNAYLEDQCWACTKTSTCADNIKRMIDSAAPDNVVFTEYLAPTNPVGTWVTYDEVNKDVNEDAWLNEIVDPLKPYLDSHPLYAKSTYSSFGNPDFKNLMARANRIVIAGVMSECCVLATVIDAIDTGTPLIYITDACSGSTEKYEQEVIDIVSFASPTHAALMTTNEYLASRS